jgi:hypothetical protein
LNKVFRHKVHPSDIKWGFIALSTKIVDQLPPKVKIIYKDQNYYFPINSVGRIVSKKFVKLLNLKENDFIILTGNDDNSYELTVQES